MDEFALGVKRFVYGLGKKVLISNFMAQIADSVFDASSAPSVVMAWVGAITYALQIYFDFSGYSDMAIGLGRMFGFHFPENFNYPYIAKSVTDFWKRWHISLSTWFRDYVYIPLGGNRVSKSRWILNFSIVWLLTGIWHGANWTFLLWGAIYCCILILERLTGFAKKLGKASHIYTLLIVTIAWVLFRAETISAGFAYLGHMFGFGASGFLDDGLRLFFSSTWLMLLIAFVGATPLVSMLFSHLRKKKLAWVETVWLGIVFVASVLEIVSASYNPFIYFNF